MSTADLCYSKYHALSNTLFRFLQYVHQGSKRRFVADVSYDCNRRLADILGFISKKGYEDIRIALGVYLAKCPYSIFSNNGTHIIEFLDQRFDSSLGATISKCRNSSSVDIQIAVLQELY